MNIALLCLIYVIVTPGLGIIYSSFFEWALHRFLMHRPTFGIRYPFERHALIHHKLFGAGPNYHLDQSPHEPADIRTIPMAWWNGPILVIVASFPIVMGVLWWRDLLPLGVKPWIVCAIFASTIALYYGVYEYTHWCMHKPDEKRWWIKVQPLHRLFQKIDRHHRRHHKYMHRNFNVFCPLADLLLGTLTNKPV